ncbi:MAG: tRNA pseudouridine(55) synthase TruB [Bacilli bacterium]|nr:tRNA pseudouridine(55) synthase TruB [Bacilli bacterium]
MDGILVVNKPIGYTSRDIVNIVGKILNIKKIGHTGTLDPIATGVLVLCIGKATKLVEILTSTEKEYIAEVTLGLNTDTLDNTGKILTEQIVHFEKEQIVETLNSMLGFYNQEVPIYSAVKLNGKKMYEYARENKEINLPKRTVEIKKIELSSDIKYKNGKTIFEFRCLVSKGTYIRSLIRDIALKLNTVGIMSNLIRTKQGSFSIDQSYDIESIKNNNYEIISISDCLESYKNIIVDDFLINKIKNGAILQNRYNENTIVFKDNNNNVLAIYKTYDKDVTKIKPWKIF